MKTEFFLISEIDKHKHKFDFDVSNNLREDTVAILLIDDIWYVEFLESGDIFINDGWEGQYAKNVVEAIAILKVIAQDLG